MTWLIKQAINKELKLSLLLILQDLEYEFSDKNKSIIRMRALPGYQISGRAFFFLYDESFFASE